VSVFDVSLAADAVEKAAPIALAATGGVISERAGVINFALEGKMLAGAFFGLATAWATENALLGLAAGMTAGAVVGVGHGVATLRFRANQVISSLAFNMIVFGVAASAAMQLWGMEEGSSPHVGALLPAWGVWHTAGAKVGVLSVAALASAFAVWWVMYRTRAGLSLRAVGEDPRAALAAGVKPSRIKMAALLVAGALAGAGGVQLSLGSLGFYNNGMVAGRGFVAVAAVILGRWHPLAAVAAAGFFGFAEAFSQRLEIVYGTLSTDVYKIIPFVLTLLVLVSGRRRTRAPGGLGTIVDEG